jgi:hypothetical protein
MTSTLLPALAAITLLSVSGCAEGVNTSEREARAWLPVAQPSLKRVIVLLRTCQPLRPSGYNHIWLSDADDEFEPAKCAFGSASGLAEIKSALRSAGVVGVAYAPSGSSQKRVSDAGFIVFREGNVTAGSSTSVDYYAEARPCLARRRRGQYWSEVELPLTKAPCRWFWSRSEG